MRKLASKFASALLIPTALLLASATPALALQVVEGSDGVSVDAVLSIKEATRIRVDGAPITNVFGNIYSTNCGAAITSAVPPQPGAPPAPATGMVNPAGEIVLECDVDKGEIYVRPVGGPGKPVNLFVSTQHATYTLLLRRSDTPADTIVIRDKTARPSRAEPGGATASARTPQHVRALKGMLVAMAADRPPTDIRVDEVNRPIQLWQEAKFALVRLYEGRGLVGERYLLTNVSTQDMVLAEQEFDRERGGVLAVSIENHNLRPGESTSVYVIRQELTMASFADNLRERWAGVAERMSPRARQWTMAALISGCGVGLLWAVFSAGSGDSAQRAAAAAAKSDVRPTNVDLMAPGSQVKDSEVWIGKAGKELESYKAERDEQRRVNRDLNDKQQELLRRLAEMEERLKSRPLDAARAASAPGMAAGPANPPLANPPESTLPRAPAALPPAPPPPVAYQRGAMPPGLPNSASPSGIDVAAASAQPQLTRVTLAAPVRASDPAEGGGKKRETLDSFLPISFTKGQLLGGLDAPTGGQAQSNPHPVLIRLSDNSVLPNRYRAEYRECFVIAAGYGDISSERAYLRTELLSCVRPNGDPLEVKIQGSVFGEDGKVGMRGRLVTKQGQMLANALLAGVVSGIGQGFSQANTTYSTSPLGSVATASGGDAYRAGIGSGVGKALDRLAQYYIKLAEQTFPIIEVDAGREIDVVLTKGVRIEGSDASTASNAPTSLPGRTDPSERYLKVTTDEE